MTKLNDKTMKIFYNFSEYEKEEDGEIQRVLKYFATGEQSGGITRKMQEILNNARMNTMWLADYFISEMNKNQMKHDAQEIGWKEGLEKGLQEGFVEGAHKKAIETARNLLKMGLSPEQVSQATSLPPEAVAELQA